MESDLKQMLTKKNVLGKQNFLMNECVVRERESDQKKKATHQTCPKIETNILNKHTE